MITAMSRGLLLVLYGILACYCDSSGVEYLCASTASKEAPQPKSHSANDQPTRPGLSVIPQLIPSTNAVSLEFLTTPRPSELRQKLQCLRLKHEAVLNIAHTPEESASWGSLIAVATYLGEIRKLTISNYVALPPALNVRPPFVPNSKGTNYTLYFAGMDPHLISNSAAREAYETAIARNQSLGQMNELQLEVIPSIEPTAKAALFTLATRVLPRVSGKGDHKRVSEVADTAQLTPSEFKHFMKLVTDAAEGQKDK